MHKLQLILIAIYLALSLAENLAHSSDEGESRDKGSLQYSQALVESARSRFKLPELFNFDYYQQLFGKQYRSIIERAVRARFYLGRAFRAFISVVSYKHNRSDSYLAVNEMSDWTPDEIDKTMMDSSLLSPLAKRDETDDIDGQAAIDLPIIEEELKDIVEHQDSSPFYRNIADELNPTDHRIERRDIHSSLRDHSLNDLVINGGKQIKAAGSKLINQLEPTDALPKQMGEMIGAIKGNKYLKSVVNRFGSSDSSRGVKKDSVRMLPDAIDIDHRKCLLAARDQGRCGSCYAFAAIALYEWAYCKATGERLAFSEQYVIDCGKSKYFMGCSCGHTHKVRKFVKTNGLELRNDYPYHALEQQCLYGPAVPPETRGSIRIEDDGWDYVHQNSIEKKLKEAPMVVNLYIQRGLFHEYGGGVDMASGCLGAGRGMHSLLLVGSGREDGNAYWLMRNSFGPNWGESGYYKMNKQSGCIMPYSGLVLKLPQKPKITRAQAKKSSSGATQNDWKQLFV